MPRYKTPPPRDDLMFAYEAALEIQRRQDLRVFQSRDLYAFCRDTLGYKDLAPLPHQEMCDSVMQGGLKQLQLWPRGHFKSSVITIGYVLFRIAEDPNLRVLIANVVLDTAIAFLREIKGHMERNERYLAIVGSKMENKEDKWTEKEIIVATRTKIQKEPTIVVAGVGQSLTGRHFDLIVADDIVNDDTVATPEQLEKTKRWFGDVQSLLDPGGQEILVGTRYHYGDIYGWIIENSATNFNIQVHSVYNTDGSILFPSRFTPDHILEIKHLQGSMQFSCQYLNDPVDDENARFKRSDFLYFEESELNDKAFFTSMTVDRAYSLEKLADSTGITIRRVDVNNHWWIVYAKRVKMREGELIELIFNLKNSFKVDAVGIEQKAYKDTIRPVLDEEMRRKNDFFTVVELKGRTSKASRVEALIPRFESHSVHFLRGFEDLEDEMLRFPKARHDDIVDSLAYHNDMMGAPSYYTDDEDLPEYVPVFGRTGY